MDTHIGSCITFRLIGLTPPFRKSENLIAMHELTSLARNLSISIRDHEENWIAVSPSRHDHGNKLNILTPSDVRSMINGNRTRWTSIYESIERIVWPIWGRPNLTTWSLRHNWKTRTGKARTHEHKLKACAWWAEPVVQILQQFCIPVSVRNDERNKE